MTFPNNPNRITSAILGAAIEVHREVGPGLLESVYQKCLLVELGLRGIPSQAEVPVALCYKGVPITSEACRIDVIVDETVVVEIKSVEELKPVHSKQLLTYLRLTNKKVGLLINFNEVLLKDGIERVVNQLEESSPDSSLSQALASNSADSAPLREASLDANS